MMTRTTFNVGGCPVADDHGVSPKNRSIKITSTLMKNMLMIATALLLSEYCHSGVTGDGGGGGVFYCWCADALVASLMLPTPNSRRHHHHHQRFQSLKLATTTSFLSQKQIHHQSIIVRMSSSSGENSSPPNYYYQRTFYRLSPNSDVQIPNALMIEERLRFQKKQQGDVDGAGTTATTTGYNDDDVQTATLEPVGPCTLILREGTSEDEITNEIFRMDLLTEMPHSGPRTKDTMIATLLWMASNAHQIQGNVLELSSSTGGAGGDGAISTLGCIASQCAILASNSDKDQLKSFVEQVQKKISGSREHDVADDIMTVPGSSSSSSTSKSSGAPTIPFPRRLHKLTLSDEDANDLQPIVTFLKSQRQWLHPDKVSVETVPWSTRISSKSRTATSSNKVYRAIVGTDLNMNYLSAKELARFVAYTLLPSNEFAVANIKSGAETAPSFGALGMDPEPSTSSYKEDFESEVDPSKASMFMHLSPDRSGYVSGTGSDDDVTYLRQFLEKGYRMSVEMEYVRMQRLEFVLTEASSEKELEDMDDLELQVESHSDYQTLTAIHHPDYAGDGMGEYFFPIETGAYEASR